MTLTLLMRTLSIPIEEIRGFNDTQIGCVAYIEDGSAVYET